MHVGGFVQKKADCKLTIVKHVNHDCSNEIVSYGLILGHTVCLDSDISYVP